MKNRLFIINIAVLIVLLFIDIAVTPIINFNIVKASNENDFVEVTTQACGIKGYGNTTVKLTREQYQNLEQYLVEFRARLNQTTTKEEAIPIFKEAVVELDKYGLLPKGISVELAQRLVTIGYKNQYSSHLLKKMHNRNPLSQNGIDNQLCMVAGNTDDCFFLGPISAVGFLVFIIIYGIISNIMEENVSLNLLDFFFSTHFIPFEIGGFGTFGSVFFDYYTPIYTSSDGWIHALGLRGVQSINGSFYGTITRTIFGDYVGLTGFIGLVVGPKPIPSSKFFFGSAYNIGVSRNPPVYPV